MSAIPPNAYDSARWRGMTIGLLGGSFNPAHAGHLHNSRVALHRLKLDAVWWLVSPGNPLKDPTGMAPLPQRLASARKAARDPRITVSTLEMRLGTRYTVATLEALKRRYPTCRFVFLMGADNLLQLDRWKNWQKLMASTPVAIVDRPGYTLPALNAKAARRFGRFRKDRHLTAALRRGHAPAWGYLFGARHGASATSIRSSGGWDIRSESET